MNVLWTRQTHMAKRSRVDKGDAKGAGEMEEDWYTAVQRAVNGQMHKLLPFPVSTAGASALEKKLPVDSWVRNIFPLLTLLDASRMSSVSHSFGKTLAVRCTLPSSMRLECKDMSLVQSASAREHLAPAVRKSVKTVIVRHADVLGGAALVPFLQMFESTTTIDVGGLPWKCNHVDMLVQAIQRPGVKRLRLGGLQFMDNAQNALDRAIQTSSSETIVELSIGSWWSVDFVKHPRPFLARLETLACGVWLEDNAEQMVALSTNCKRLRVLDLSLSSGWSAAHAKAFLIPTLRRLTLRFTNRPDTPSMVELLVAHPQLTHIHLDGELDLSDDRDVDHIFKTHKALEVFRLSHDWTHVQRDVGITAAVRHVKATIRRIDCNWSYDGVGLRIPHNDRIALLKQLPNLQSYYDGRIWPPTGDDGKLNWNIYAQWPRLEELHLESPEGPAWSADWAALRPLRRLRALAIWFVADFSDDALVELATHHPLIRHFDVRGEGQLSARAWTAMATHWPRLEALYVQLRFADAVDLHDLVRACNRLQWVCLYNESAAGGQLPLPLDDAWRTRMQGIIHPGRIHIDLHDKYREATWGTHPRWAGFKRPRFDDLHPASSRSLHTNRVAI
jgi:hypothetical protein